MNETHLNPTEISRKKIQSLLIKKGYKTTKPQAIGGSMQYWIVYTESKIKEICKIKNNALH